MTDFLSELRSVQKEELKKQITPDQVYKRLNQSALDFALHSIQSAITDEAKKNPTSKTLEGKFPLCAPCYTARINRTRDVVTKDYIIDFNILPGDDYSDFATQNNDCTWLRLAPLYHIEQSHGIISNKCRFTLTERGKAFCAELKKMCAAQKITVNFCAHAAWRAANTFYSGDVFVDLDKEFKAKGPLINYYLAVDFSVKL